MDNEYRRNRMRLAEAEGDDGKRTATMRFRNPTGSICTVSFSYRKGDKTDRELQELRCRTMALACGQRSIE